ncbi:hypothetical protein Trydic_g21040, partial [Trypoxylus dichotomus]
TRGDTAGSCCSRISYVVYTSSAAMMCTFVRDSTALDENSRAVRLTEIELANSVV